MSRVSIYMDKERNIIIIPYWKDKNGISRKSIHYSELEVGYTEEILGEEIMISLEVSGRIEFEELTQDTWKKAGKVKSWKAFQRKYDTVLVDIDEKGICYIAKYRKLEDGSYGLEKGDEEKYSRRYTEPLTAEQLGHIVLEMLDIK